MQGKRIQIPGMINIDTLFDTLISTQESVGADTSVDEADYNPVTGKRLKMGETVKEEKESPKESCTSCPKKEKKQLNCFEAGIFNYVPDEGDEDQEDGEYLCEYCNKLGYSQKYKPSVCDNCSDCETCSEFDKGDCDGCSFSIYRDGTPYSSKIKKEDFMSPEDLVTISKLEQHDFTDTELRSNPIGQHFTVLDW